MSNGLQIWSTSFLVNSWYPGEVSGCGSSPLHDVRLWVPCFDLGSEMTLLQVQPQMLMGSALSPVFSKLKISLINLFQLLVRGSLSVWTHKNQNFQNISVSCKRGGPHILNGNHLGQFGLTGNPHLHSRMERMERLSLLSKSWLAQGPSRQDLWLGQQQHMTYEQPLGLGGLFRWCLRWSQGHAPSRPPCSAKIFFCSLGS